MEPSKGLLKQPQSFEPTRSRVCIDASNNIASTYSLPSIMQEQYTRWNLRQGLTTFTGAAESVAEQGNTVTAVDTQTGIGVLLLEPTYLPFLQRSIFCPAWGTLYPKWDFKNLHRLVKRGGMSSKKASFLFVQFETGGSSTLWSPGMH
jgi:hypothetical protein